MIVYLNDVAIGEVHKDVSRDCWNCWHYDSDETFELWNVGIAEAREAVIHVAEEHLWNSRVGPEDPCRAKVHELVHELSTKLEEDGGGYWNKEYIIRRLKEVLA